MNLTDSEERNLGIIIPTLQRRPDMLLGALSSALDSSPSQVVVISPDPPGDYISAHLSEKCLWIVDDANLPQSINVAVKRLKPEITHFAWIGDDDSMLPKEVQEIFNECDLGHLLIGYCHHIDANGELLWVQEPRLWRMTTPGLVMFTSPISQPASIISRAAFDKVGGISPEYPLAFDQDLFTRLVLNFGPPNLVKRSFARFRVHNESLSFKNGKAALRESAQIRRSNAPPHLKGATITVDMLRILANSIRRPLI